MLRRTHGIQYNTYVFNRIQLYCITYTCITLGTASVEAQALLRHVQPRTLLRGVNRVEEQAEGGVRLAAMLRAEREQNGAALA